MITLPIPKEDQIRAMLDGRTFDLLRDYDINPERVDFRKFITVQRQNLIDFLSIHPDAAEDYFRKHSITEATHDVGKIWQDGSGFMTAWMDHGRPRSIWRFETLSEAIAEHVLITHGMY